MSAVPVAPNPFAPDTEKAIAQLRREAASAVARQRLLRVEIARVRAQARDVERQASRAFARGDEIFARQILARGLFALQTRDALEAALADSRSEVSRLLTTMVRAENRAWLGSPSPGSVRRTPS
jgi:phage shock protein A